MHALARVSLLVSLFVTPLIGACSDDDSSPTNAAAGAAGAAGGAGFAGAAGSADNRALVKAMARDDVACATPDDCCVVVDGCRATGYVVSATDAPNAASLLSAAPNDGCVKCITPAIEVGCVAGKCVGSEVPASTATPQLRQNHCGSTSTGAGGATIHVLGCG